jgi:hypothetical protein
VQVGTAIALMMTRKAIIKIYILEETLVNFLTSDEIIYGTIEAGFIPEVFQNTLNNR